MVVIRTTDPTPAIQSSLARMQIRKHAMTQDDNARQTPEADDLKYRFLKGFMRFFGFLMLLFGLGAMAAFGLQGLPFVIFGAFIMMAKIKG
jgi:hypothetical protein